MPQPMDYGIQAHILFSEVVGLVTKLSACADARISIIPTSRKPIVLKSGEDIVESDVLSVEATWLAVTPRKPVLAGVSQAMDFVNKNDDHVLFSFSGNLTKKVLVETGIEMSVGNVPNRKCWMAFKRDMLKMLPTGAWIWSYDGGLREFDKRHRISIGARQFWADGGDLRTFTLIQVDSQEYDAVWKGVISPK